MATASTTKTKTASKGKATEKAARKPAAPKKAESAKKPSAASGPAAGDEAPDFELVADDGKAVKLADLAGKKVVLYFYPRDNTPGCTREACAFQEKLAAIHERGAVVLGVSRDSTKSHQGFKDKYKLAFPLLSDPDFTVHKAYGAYGTKVMYGKATEGVLRSTVIIDAQGKIAKRFASVKVDGHADQVLAALDAMG